MNLGPKPPAARPSLATAAAAKAEERAAEPELDRAMLEARGSLLDELAAHDLVALAIAELGSGGHAVTRLGVHDRYHTPTDRGTRGEIHGPVRVRLGETRTAA